MDGSNKTSLSDDEEDLEALRLAALQTLKKNATSSHALPNSQKGSVVGTQNDTEPPFRSGNRHFSHKRGRFYAGRGTKNGQFHTGRAVSSNLISLTPSVPREEMRPRHNEETSNSKSILPLPQDRYSKKATDEAKSDEASSKFDRYKDSDNSDEEESEEEITKSGSDDDSPLKLERSDSLEALMQELDDEIQGRNKLKDKEEKLCKGKIKTKRKKETSKIDNDEVRENESKTETSIVLDRKLKEKDQGVDRKNKEESTSVKTMEPLELIDSNKLSDSKDNIDVLNNKERSPEREPQLKKRRHSPPLQRDFVGYRGKPRNFRHSPPLQKPPFLTGMGTLPFPHNNPPPVFNNPPFGQSNLIMNTVPFYERPLSPLLINAETLQTQTMAPLSPRSAAFVLKNRAIIEKRKRSPRRSYSRSPSPRGWSLSPRRSVSPLRRRSLSPRKRSLSPRKRQFSPRKRSLSPPRMRSKSPKRRSVSPKRRSPSPKRRTFSPKQRALSPRPRPFSPKRRSQSPKRKSPSPKRRERKELPDASKNKLSIRDRLGFKSSPKLDEKDNKEKSQSEFSPQKDDKILDPILEARKKKFEAREIKVREGVIRLKPKDEAKADKVESDIPEVEIPKEETDTEIGKAEVTEELILNEDALLEDDELDLEAQMDLFSDEESGSENEGRFKAKEQAVEKPPVPSFSKLINGAKKEVKSHRVSENKEKKAGNRSRSPHERTKESGERKSVEINSAAESIGQSKLKLSKLDRGSTRKKLGVKSERHPKKFDRKIEIKIKNPSKYERVDKIEGQKDGKVDKERGMRKVELGSVTRHGGDDDDDETEIVVENDEDEVENTISNEGDLRAQLSKKRAEKLQKKSPHEEVTSRLLQNALQNVIPMKKSKKSKSKELSSSDGKLPIHLRLGLAGSSEVFTKPKRKSKKRKNTETEDQV